MKRRRAQAALIACLILFVVAGSWRGGVVHRKHSRHHHAGRRPPPPAQELAAAGVATIRRQGCRLKKVDILCNDGEKNQSLVVDNDKRRVPTGSNPLHNSCINQVYQYPEFLSKGINKRSFSDAHESLADFSRRLQFDAVQFKPDLCLTDTNLYSCEDMRATCGGLGFLIGEEMSINNTATNVNICPRNLCKGS
ncbi:uncharacterized protein LOC122027623 isoform X2 [Zingiber officinale]|uniref:uncharacterized protein LOC122027623 isoform X2 n=1 Tax=Zingiber officinale TaxID=94328 RepID=UPI001C4B12BB|nr:uncharacterized protein LOC122027623 isoform X2 [Zingiber officinale]